MVIYLVIAVNKLLETAIIIQYSAVQCSQAMKCPDVMGSGNRASKQMFAPDCHNLFIAMQFHELKICRLHLKLPTTNFRTVKTNNLKKPRDRAPLSDITMINVGHVHYMNELSCEFSRAL